MNRGRIDDMLFQASINEIFRVDDCRGGRGYRAPKRLKVCPFCGKEHASTRSVYCCKDHFLKAREAQKKTNKREL